MNWNAFVEPMFIIGTRNSCVGKFAIVPICACLLIGRAAFGATTPIVAYHFDEGSGAMVSDQSGNNYNGTLKNGPTWSSGKNGGGLSFDGVDDYVTAGDVASADGLNQITISAWVKFNVSGGGGKETHFIDKSRCDGAVSGGPWELGVSLTQSHKAEFLVYPSNGSPYSYVFSGSSTTSVDDGQWHYVTGRYDGAYLSIWIDGVQQNSISAPGLTMSNSGNALELGGHCNGYAYSFAGKLDDVRIYNRALTSAEIQSDMATPVGGIASSSADTTPPTIVIASPKPDATISGRIRLQANATDNVGVIGVRFLLDGVAIDNEVQLAPFRLYWDTKTVIDGRHDLTAIARDAAGNTSTTAATSIVINNYSGDVVAPSAPNGLVQDSVTSSGVVFHWNASSDNVGVTGYRIFRDGQPIGTSGLTTFSDNGLTASTSYAYTVGAFDAAGNSSAMSSTLVVTTSAPALGDVTPPSTPM